MVCSGARAEMAETPNERQVKPGSGRCIHRLKLRKPTVEKCKTRRLVAEYGHGLLRIRLHALTLSGNHATCQAESALRVRLLRGERQIEYGAEPMVTTRVFDARDNLDPRA